MIFSAPYFSAYILFLLLAFCLALKFAYFSHNILVTLLSLEFLTLILLLFFVLILLNPSSIMIFSIFVLAVVEGALGLCLLISNARNQGSLYVKLFIFKLSKLKTFKVFNGPPKL